MRPWPQRAARPGSGEVFEVLEGLMDVEVDTIAAAAAAAAVGTFRATGSRSLAAIAAQQAWALYRHHPRGVPLFRLDALDELEEQVAQVASSCDLF